MSRVDRAGADSRAAQPQRGAEQALALNCGSSSVKLAVLAPDSGRRSLDARIENIGESSCRMRADGTLVQLDDGLSFEGAIRKLIELARSRFERSAGVQFVAHRVVHGGAKLVDPQRIDEASLHTLDELSVLAPLHNPPALAGIRIARAMLPDIPHVAVFDTAFHASLPAHVRDYALPRELAERHGIRRYGFHGTSHAHVARVVSARLKAPAGEARIISCHLGNGASVAAIRGGRSIETSMGMTPMEGLVMGTRAGDLDPGIVLLLQSKQWDLASLEDLLNMRSGLTGLTGTSDMQQIERRAGQGEPACKLAIDIYVHRVRKYIGAYAAIMGGVDAIAFTGGVGENSALIRERCLERMEFLGAMLDEATNRGARLEAEAPMAKLSASASRVALYAVRADEEHSIAREAAALLQQAAA